MMQAHTFAFGNTDRFRMFAAAGRRLPVLPLCWLQMPEWFLASQHCHHIRLFMTHKDINIANCCQLKMLVVYKK